MREGLCDSNPVVATNNPAAGVLSRDRVLTDDELTIVWRACQMLGIPGRIVRLLILLGCRRHEIGGLRWDEVDLETATLIIPGDQDQEWTRARARTAAGRARAHCRHATPRENTSSAGAAARSQRWSVLKIRLDLQIATAIGRPLAPFRLHDLRRTMRSGLGRLGIPPHVAELSINHVKGGIQAVYDRYHYQPEIKMALARWAEHVLAVVEGREEKIVALRA